MVDSSRSSIDKDDQRLPPGRSPCERITSTIGFDESVTSSSGASMRKKRTVESFSRRPRSYTVCKIGGSLRISYVLLLLQVTLRLTMKEWQYSETAPADAPLPVPSMSRIDSVLLLTGRTIRVTVVGARDLKPSDYSGFSDPYVKLQYGNITRKTKTVRRFS